jgi:hypothetical protein
MMCAFTAQCRGRLRPIEAALLQPEPPACSNSPGKHTVTVCFATDRYLISNAPWTGIHSVY